MEPIEGIVPTKEKVDRRVVRTRSAIVEAYLRLILEKDPDEITVSAIAREARVDRKTFYAHFGSIDGLLDAICSEIVTRIADMVEEDYKNADEEFEDPSSRAFVEYSLHRFFKKVNEAICSNLFLHKRLVEGMSTEEILDRIRVPLEREIVRRNLTGITANGQRMNWAISYFIGGALSLYRTWISTGDEASLEEVSAMAESFMMDGLAAVYAWEDAPGAAPDETRA